MKIVDNSSTGTVAFPALSDAEMRARHDVMRVLFERLLLQPTTDAHFTMLMGEIEAYRHLAGQGRLTLPNLIQPIEVLCPTPKPTMTQAELNARLARANRDNR